MSDSSSSSGLSSRGLPCFGSPSGAAEALGLVDLDLDLDFLSEGVRRQSGLSLERLRPRRGGLGDLRRRGGLLLGDFGGRRPSSLSSRSSSSPWQNLGCGVNWGKNGKIIHLKLVNISIMDKGQK